MSVRKPNASNRHWPTALSVVAGLAIFSSLAHAAPILTGDIVFSATPPTSVQLGATESATTLTGPAVGTADALLFQELSQFLLPSQIYADVTSPTVVSSGTGATPGSIAAGTLVNSFFFHLDDDDNTMVSRVKVFSISTITFETDILGVILFDSSLDATDPVLGAPGTLYPASGIEFRGLTEVDAGDDLFELSADNRTLQITARTNFGSVDQMRIITVSAVPVPAAVWLFGTALIGFIGMSRRRKVA